MPRPLVRRTWAPQGGRPVVRCRGRRDRLSVIAGLTLSPGGRRAGFHFTTHGHDVRTAGVQAFIRRVRRQVRRPLLVIMDRLPAHKSAAKRLAGDGRLAIEWLPAYAPDPNPAEAAWSHTKYGDLANHAPDDLIDLEIEAEISLGDARGDQKLLRSFFQAARLTL